ncbi:MAG: YbbR family protein, partial [Spirochaetes bacterium]
LTLFFNLTRLEQRMVNIPLAVSINDEMAPSSQYPRMVRVALRGERDVIYGIREDEISASLDLSGYRNEGIYRIPVKLEKRGNALTADPLEIHPDPSEIAVGLEKRARKKLPVTPSFKGFLESGFELISFDVMPAEIVVSGPAGLVARTDEIATETIELGGKKGDFSVNVRLIKKESLLTLEEIDTVTFSAKVRQAMDLRNYTNLPILAEGLAPNLVLADLLPTGSIRLHASENLAAKIDPATLFHVDLSSFMRPGTYNVEIKIRQPEGAVVETFEPQTVSVRLAYSATPATSSEPKE